MSWTSSSCDPAGRVAIRALMLDALARRRLLPALDPAAAALDALGVRASHVTAVGLVVGVAACIAAGLALWPVALGLWLGNRVLDGLDGALARRRGATDLGGFLDFVADFVVYGGFVLGVAVAVPDARVACCALLAAYLLNNVAQLTFASLVEKHGLGYGDERSIRLTPGLTEGTETIIAYTAFCLLPSHAEIVAWTFAAMVLFTTGQRIVLAHRAL
jgi:phosphatidylglycerophosphate synthase